MSKKVKHLFFNFIILIVASCLILFIAEIFIRAFSSETNDNRWNGQDKKYYEYDPLLGWQKIRNLDTKRVTAGKQPVLYQVNSKGIRGPEYSYKKPDNEYRIIFLGDSFTEGYMIEFHELFPEVLKGKLNMTGSDKHYESINTGTCGYSTDQELLSYQDEGKKYNPDLTILMFYQNDVAYINQPKDWGMNYKPLFKIRNGEPVLSNFPVPKPDLFIIHEQLEPKKKSALERLRGWFDIHSYLYKLVKERIKNTYKLRKLAAKANFMGASENEKESIPIEFRVWEKNYNDTVRDAWKTIEALIIKLRNESDSAGSKLLVFYVPYEGSIYGDKWDKLKKNYGLTDENWNPDQAAIVVGDICKRNNIAFLNPTALFRAKAEALEKDKKSLYDPLDGHWSVEGNEFVGDILTDYIQLHYLNRE